MKLSQLAAKFGVSRERARQLEQRLKGRIRAYLQEELGEDFEPPAKKRRPGETIAQPIAISAVPRLRTAHSAPGSLTKMEEMVEVGWSDAQADCRRVFEENSHPMWVVEDLELVDVNRAALLHYGYSRDEFLGHDHRRSRRRKAAAADQDRPAAGARSGNIGGRTDRSSTWRSPRSRSPSAGGRRRWTPFSTSPTGGGRRPRPAISISCWRRSTTRWSPATTSSSSRGGTPPPNRPTEDAPKRCWDSRTRWCSAPISSGVQRAEAIKRLLETGRFHGELTHRRGDGKRIHIESRAAALFDRDGKRLGYVSVNRDITERRYAQETIRALLKRGAHGAGGGAGAHRPRAAR